MLIACYNVYNEGEHLPESVESLYDHVGKIVFVDGRYKGFYDDRPVASTDGMIAWIKDKNNDPDGKFHLVKAPKHPWKNQAVKRSAYLVGKPGDAYLYIDGHELVVEWREINLLLGDIGFARLDFPDEDNPVSVKAPRLIGHKEGIKYVTHTMLSRGKDEEFYVNLGWDHQTLGDIKGFWQRVPVETCSLTIRHIGKQKKGLIQRQDQVKEEREKIEVFDNARGLNFTVDSRVAIDRMTDRLHKTWVRDANIRCLAPPTFQESRAIVAAYAEDWEKKQRILREKHTYLKTQMVCDKCGFICTSMSMLLRHIQEKHKR